ncbi:pantoate--beta-alanine ligase [Brachyspira hyodysenteriae]|uniref:Pantothenate synthetase n=1 Tax=Brachyspira hyodysenteriae ATCC 27164 TaxID=1266923 RepID=A0A3B6VQS5_BRAHO|nr:pantoate--beta-alanine ligase [Brachyspira hyodysenteriae]ANN63285.1 pantoate--beta-alanine ligase [Brachyspira hyodysenteriae ATCC 27164]KLI24345.1 pantoate--beta-alanine ligase [Brachyspira hyodysenteriae]MCZ9925625.1 pantoate--beta-alanine ligase [Brachyspira hyodysenteriae]TVL78309.1 pantoate--beta-alanine ligase [Brachyspira hyodysenteriae]TVL86220.1 pantoate--beta-alanine ligase [Brachyspira hyodysenteriae]
MALTILKNIKSAYKFISDNKDKTIALIPTMGALHEGHAALIKKAKKECNIVIVSIFLNPLQFTKVEDIEKYPEDLDKDKKLLSELQADVLFLPSVEEMIPDDYAMHINIENNKFNIISRPIYYRGIITITLKLFNIISPTYVYLTEYDYQEMFIIKKIIKDLNYNIALKTIPIVRDENMIALSSLNSLLSEREKEEATIIYKLLKEAREEFKKGGTKSSYLIDIIKNNLKSHKMLKLEYIYIADKETLANVETATRNSIILISCYCGSTRLLDNMPLK